MNRLKKEKEATELGFEIANLEIKREKVALRY